ncbi:hypothetical protein [Lacunimicrobium album]
MLIYSLEEYIELNGYPIHPAAREFLRKFPDYGVNNHIFPGIKGIWGQTTDLRRLAPGSFREWRSPIREAEKVLKISLSPVGAGYIYPHELQGCDSLRLIGSNRSVYLLTNFDVLYKAPVTSDQIQSPNELFPFFDKCIEVCDDDDDETISTLPILQLSLSQHARMYLTYLTIDVKDRYPTYILYFLGLAFLYWIIF